MDDDAVMQRQEQLLRYVRNAVTAENVNRFAHTVLKHHRAITAQTLVEQHPQTDELVKIIGLHTYSTSAERSYDVTMKPNFVECQGLRFQDFTVQRRG